MTRAGEPRCGGSGSAGDAIGRGLDGIVGKTDASRTALHSVEAAPKLPPSVST